MNRWVNVAVVMGCVGTLIALMLPGIGSHQVSGRTQCINSQGQIARALIAYAGRYDGVLPQMRGDVTVEHDANLSTPPLRAAWSVTILPDMDNRRIYDHLTSMTIEDNADSSSPYSFASLTNNILRGYTCPEDPRLNEPMALSYVANGGYISDIDWDTAATNSTTPTLDSIDWRNDTQSEQFDRFSEEDRAVSNAAGVFLDGGPRPYHTNFSDMYDGASATILLSENLDAGSWSDTNFGSIGFGARIETSNRVPWHYGVLGNGQSSAIKLTGIPTTIADHINSHSLGLRATPRPSSNHPGGVVATFCDGRTRFLSETIDSKVYRELLTPSSGRYGGEVIFGSTVP